MCKESMNASIRGKGFEFQGEVLGCYYKQRVLAIRDGHGLKMVNMAFIEDLKVDGEAAETQKFMKKWKSRKWK